MDAAELEPVAAVLLRTGAGALAWRRIADTPLADTAVGQQLQQAYRHHALQALLRERDLVTAFRRFRAAGLDLMLVKGWGVARLYPQTGLRPYGDLDLCVPPDQLPEARRLRDALTDEGRVQTYLEMGAGYTKVFDRTAEELFGASVEVPLQGESIRIPCPEDHLRLLCTHMLQHGAWRPLWLCDLAVFLERLPEGFRWERLMRGHAGYTSGVQAALRLAHAVLGASLERTPLDPSVPLPRWLLPALLAQWESGEGASQMRPLRHAGNSPSGLRLASFAHHWRDPIRATAEVGAPFNDWPRLPFQLAALGWRGLQVLGKALRK